MQIAEGHVPEVPIAFRKTTANGEICVEGMPFLSSLANEPYPEDIEEVISALFFGSARTISAIAGAEHFHFPGVLNQANKDAYLTLARHLQLRNFDQTDSLSTADLAGSVAVVGGPASSIHSRMLMGWGGEMSPLLKVVLPVYFQPSRPGTVRGGRGDPWTVVINRRPSQQECLVITSTPLGLLNDRLTNFAGLRGAGTRALGQLFSNRHLLERLWHRTRTFEAWQAVIEIEGTDSQRPAFGAIEVFEVPSDSLTSSFVTIRDKLIFDAQNVVGMAAALKRSNRLRPEELIDLGKGYSLELYYAVRDGISQIGMVPEQGHAVTTTSDGLHSHIGRDMVAEPLPFEEAVMSSLARRPGRFSTDADSVQVGRPPTKSKPSLNHRFQMVLSDQDVEKVIDLKQLFGTDSAAKAIRRAIADTHKRLMKT